MSLVTYHVVGDQPYIPGTAYEYVLAGDGLWIEAEGKLLSARVPVAAATVRGLPSLGPILRLHNGKIPQRLWELAFSVMLASPEKERYIGVRWQDGYQLYIPEQDGRAAGVTYQAGENIILDLHSHAGMGAFFSGTDNADEQGLRIYGVVGRIDDPIIKLRLGVYGYFMPVKWSDIFDGSLYGAIELKEETPDEL